MALDNFDSDNRYTKVEKRLLVGATLFTGGVVLWGVGHTVASENASPSPMVTDSQSQSTYGPPIIEQSKHLQNQPDKNRSPISSIAIDAGLVMLAGYGIYKASQMIHRTDTWIDPPHATQAYVVPHPMHDALPVDPYYDRQFNQLSEFLIWDDAKGTFN